MLCDVESAWLAQGLQPWRERMRLDAAARASSRSRLYLDCPRLSAMRAGRPNRGRRDGSAACRARPSGPARRSSADRLHTLLPRADVPRPNSLADQEPRRENPPPPRRAIDGATYGASAEIHAAAGPMDPKRD